MDIKYDLKDWLPIPGYGFLNAIDKAGRNPLISEDQQLAMGAYQGLLCVTLAPLTIPGIIYYACTRD